MQLAQKQNLHRLYSLTIVKSFLIWSFTLTVCMVVVGFPVVVLMFSVGSFLAVILQSVLPVSAVLVISSSLIAAHVMAIIAGAGILTAKGIHPEDVSWLHWLHGEVRSSQTPIYASCPLTCGLTR